jgi:hypothetical protein
MAPLQEIWHCSLFFHLLHHCWSSCFFTLNPLSKCSTNFQTSRRNYFWWTSDYTCHQHITKGSWSFCVQLWYNSVYVLQLLPKCNHPTLCEILFNLTDLHCGICEIILSSRTAASMHFGGKVKLSLYMPWRTLGLREFEAPTFSDIRLIDGGRVVSPTRRPLLTPGKIPVTHLCSRLSRPQGHSPAGRIR